MIPNRSAVFYLIGSIFAVSVVTAQVPPSSPTAFSSVCDSTKGKPPDDATKKTVDAMIAYIKSQLGPLDDLGMDLNCQTYQEILTKFEKISLSDKHLTDLKPIATLPQLAAVNLSGNDISDVTALQGLTKLRSLGIGRNQIHDLAPLRALANLETLDVSANGLTDLAPIRDLKKLRKFVAAANAISDASALAGLGRLEELNLSGNRLKDVQSLNPLNSLKRLDLSHNQIQNIAPLSSLSQLDQLNVQSNLIADISLYYPNSTRILNFLDNPIPEQQFVALKTRSSISNSPLLWIYYGTGDKPKRLQ